VAAAVVVTDLPRMVVRKAEVEEVAINEEDVVVEAVEVVAATEQLPLRLTMIVLKPILLYNTILCWKYTNLL
jgi:hypothetical protein